MPDVSSNGIIQSWKNFKFLLACGLAATAFPALGENLPALTNGPNMVPVVEVENPGATVAFEPQPAIVQTMVDQGILKLTGKPDLKMAWRTFFTNGDIVGIKVYSEPGANSGTRPAVAAAVIEGLLGAGLAPDHIVIWDKQLWQLRLAGYSDLAERYHVRLAAAADTGYDESAVYTNNVIGTLMAGDLEFDHYGHLTGSDSYMTKLLTKTITKIISIAPLLNNNQVGVCGHLYSVAMGSVDNTLRFEGNAVRLAAAVPEIYAQKAISDHVVLNITDALIGQYEGEQLSRLHSSTALNQIWLSKDPVALDFLAVKELDMERRDRDLDPVEANPTLFNNASFYLELGVDDPSRIRIETVK